MKYANHSAPKNEQGSRHMPHHKDFRDACMAWLQSSLPIVASVPLYVSHGVEITLNPTNDGYSALPVNIPEYGMTVLELRTDLYSMPEYGVLRDLIARDPSLSAVMGLGNTGELPSDHHQQEQNALRYFDVFLVEYLRKTNAINQPVAIDIFDTIYNQLQQFIYFTSPFIGLWQYDLRNLNMESDLIQLEPDIYLRQATTQERQEHIQQSHSSPIGFSGPPVFTDAPKVFLEIHQGVDRWSWPDQMSAFKASEIVLLALRLLKGNPVGFSGSRWRVLDQPFRVISSFSTGAPLPFHAFRGDTYILTHDDTDELKNLWIKAKLAKDDDALSTAITRLDDSYGRVKPEDKLIDYWIALESIFLRQGTREVQPGSFVATSVAHYLGTTLSERQSIYNIIMESHGLRNKIIHPEIIERRGKIDEMVTKTGDYLRQALRRRVMEY